MNEDPLGIGIVGCGVIAPAHIESFQLHDGARVVAVCDTVPERAKALAERYGIEHADVSLADLLAREDVHAVSVCTGHADHASQVIAALEAGKHVLCEKPLATRTQDLDAMVEAAAKQSLVAEGVFQHRFDACYRFLCECVREKRIGDLVHIDAHLNCYRSQEYYTDSPWRGRSLSEGGSLLINQAIHFLDQILWIGQGVRSVAAITANLGHEGVIDTEDTASLSMELKSGALASFHGSSASHLSWSSRFQVVGKEAVLTVEDGHLVGIQARDPQLAAELQAAADELEEAQRLSAVKSHYGPSHPRMIADFVESIRLKRSPQVPFSEARKAVDLVLAAYRSAGSGKRVILE